MLASKYKINKIYVEGAVGSVDTSWLSAISDSNLKQTLLDNLLEEGILTGAEYYSVKADRPKVLHGIENPKIYLDNFARLVQINENQQNIKDAFANAKMFISVLSDGKLSKENRRLDKTIKKYNSGKISFDKYAAYLYKQGKEKNTYFGFYPEIVSFLSAQQVKNKLDNKKINTQVAMLLEELKPLITYGEFSALTDAAANAQTEISFYFDLAKIYKRLNFAGKYYELEEFFKYLSSNQQTDPLELLKEENALVNELKDKSAKSETERELIFLSFFINIFEGFLTNKITAPQYQYFKTNFERFQTLWTKYTKFEQVPDLAQYYPLFEGFYADNINASSQVWNTVNMLLRLDRRWQL
jgi:hypothetical protein